MVRTSSTELVFVYLSLEFHLAENSFPISNDSEQYRMLFIHMWGKTALP